MPECPTIHIKPQTIPVLFYTEYNWILETKRERDKIGWESFRAEFDKRIIPCGHLNDVQFRTYNIIGTKALAISLLLQRYFIKCCNDIEDNFYVLEIGNNQLQFWIFNVEGHGQPSILGTKWAVSEAL